MNLLLSPARSHLRVRCEVGTSTYVRLRCFSHIQDGRGERLPFPSKRKGLKSCSSPGHFSLMITCDCKDGTSLTCQSCVC
ncbi:hypothetical protein AAFF_G00268560 [Aldrovandia affinis]|uniref:Uncharacterized protein n=1 Tax=Aldrovandia affinis TaxID=143900 RepID=A0AAD7STC7_9TELE|nr:hypothetical protein AAFF_G00268560 [Aldrovandia affinis]